MEARFRHEMVRFDSRSLETCSVFRWGWCWRQSSSRVWNLSRRWQSLNWGIFDLVGGEAAAREIQGVFWKKLRSFCCVKDGHYPNVRSRLLEVDQELWKGRCLPRRDAGDLQLRSRSCEIKSTHLETGERWSSHTFIPLAGDQPLEQADKVVWKKATVGEV